MKYLMFTVWLALILGLALPSTGRAQASNCTNLIDGGILCPPPMGTITMDQMGNFVCGPGQCAVDSRGRVMCSAKTGGAVAVDMRGEVLCVGGCLAASPAACERPVK